MNHSQNCFSSWRTIKTFTANQSPCDIKEIKHLKWQMTTTACAYNKQNVIVHWCEHQYSDLYSSHSWCERDFLSFMFPFIIKGGSLAHSAKHLLYCVAQKKVKYRFRTTWGRVNDARTFIFWVNYAFKAPTQLREKQYVRQLTGILYHKLSVVLFLFLFTYPFSFHLFVCLRKSHVTCRLLQTRNDWSLVSSSSETLYIAGWLFSWSAPFYMSMSPAIVFTWMDLSKACVGNTLIPNKNKN